jgi:KaiC/GvpD/RAD55 family RecA-like ATPase
VEDIDRIKTYAQGLDKHIAGGIPKGSVSIVCGAPGTMKSSFCYSILYNNALKANTKGLYLTLEQDVNSLRTQMRMLKMMDHEDISIVDFGCVQNKIHKQKSEDNWIHRIKVYIDDIKDKGYDLIVIDSLDALYSLTNIKDPRREIFYFFTALRDTGITSLLISEMSSSTSNFSQYGVEGFLSDAIIHMDLQKRGDVLSSLERFIGIVKMRNTNHETQYFPMLYSDNGFRVFARDEVEL